MVASAQIALSDFKSQRLEKQVNFLEFLFVPMILLLTVVMPIGITLYYRNSNNSGRGLTDEDREVLEEVLDTLDRMTDRIVNLEAILDADRPNWRNEMDDNR